MKQSVTHTHSEEKEIDLKEILRIIFKYKWSILLITLLTTSAVFAYLYFKPSIYRSSALIEVKSSTQEGLIGNEQSNGSNAIGKEKIDKEIEILQTFYINNKVLNKINFKTRYFIDSGFKKAEIYQKVPIEVKDIAIFDDHIIGKMIKVIPHGEKFSLKIPQSLLGKLSRYNPFRSKKKGIVLDEKRLYDFNTTVETDYFAFEIIKHSRFDKPIYITLQGDNKHIFDTIKKNLIVTQVTKFAPSFIEQSIEDKSKKTEKLIEFINKQLKETKQKLNHYEAELEKYKIQHNAIQPSLQGTTYINELSKLDNELSNYRLKERLINDILKMSKQQSNINAIATSLMKLDDQPTMALINRLQEIQIREEELRAKYSYKHPSLRPVRKQIYHIKKNIMKNIKNLKLRVAQKIQSLEKLKASYKKKLDALPTKERKLVGLKRDYEVSSTIYDHLLKKKSENQMIKVAIQSDYRVIDYAKNTRGIPVKPKRLFSILAGILIGLILGIAQAFVRNYFDDKISSKKELEDLTTLPIYGLLPEVKKKNIGIEVLDDPKSPYAEAHRSLRTNLQFTQNKNHSHVILVSSTIMGEGKSTTVANLSAIFNLAGYKCIVINLDLRKPTLHKFFNVDNSVGMSTYLSGKNEIDEIIYPSQYENLDIITSGPIPPNPSELIMTDRMKELIEALRERYDYIFIDSAPLGLVTDTMNVMPYVDISLIIFRENYSKKAFVKDLDSLVERHGLKHIGVVLNGSSMSGGSYGYGYGY